MRNVLLTICIIFCVGCPSVMAQDTFNKAYSIIGYDYANDVTIVNGGYYLVGTGSFSYNNLISSIKISKMDLDGNLLWTKKYGTETRDRNIGLPGMAVMDGEGNFYFAGASADTIETSHFLVGKLNESGDSMWFRTVRDSARNNYMYGICYDSASNRIYATGGSAMEDNMGSKAAVWVLDTAGNTIDIWYYQWSDFDVGVSISRIGDTIYISGYNYDYSNNNRESEPFWARLDTAGNLIDQKFFGTTGRDDYAAFDYKEGKFLLRAQLDTFAPPNGIASLSMMDADGNISWRNFFAGYGFIYQAKMQQDGTIILIGTTNENINRGKITKLDSVGNVVWDRRYSFNDPDTSGASAVCYFYDFDVDTVTKAIVVTGSTQRDPDLGATTWQDFWLVKLDSMGCLVPGCDTITNVGIAPIETAGTKVTVYPNPAKYTAHVLLNHGTPNAELDFTLFGLSGQAILTQKHQLNPYGFAEWIIDLDGLAPGTYIYRITSGGKVSNGKLLVE